MFFGLGWIGTREIEEVAEFAQEKGVIGAFSRFGILPSFSEANSSRRFQFSGSLCITISLKETPPGLLFEFPIAMKRSGDRPYQFSRSFRYAAV